MDSMRNFKQILILVIFGAGLAMLLYGIGLNVAPVFSEDNDKGFATPEPELIKEVSVGGLERRDGKLHKTYTGQSPSVCPT